MVIGVEDAMEETIHDDKERRERENNVNYEIDELEF